MNDILERAARRLCRVENIPADDWSEESGKRVYAWEAVAHAAREVLMAALDESDDGLVIEVAERMYIAHVPPVTAGMKPFWNKLTPFQRIHWINLARSAVSALREEVMAAREASNV